MKRLTKLLVCFLGILAIDICSKAFISRLVAYPFGNIEVFHNVLGIDFALSYVKNRGSAWGLFSEWHLALVSVRLAAIAALIVYLIKFNAEKKRDFPLTLVVTGAIGNVIDCFVYGHVVDMFHFTLWGWSCPVFNVADASIFCGVVTMLFQSALAKRKGAKLVSTKE